VGKVVTLYTRKTCSLCDKMHAVVDRVRAEEPFDLRVVDLDTEAPADKRAAYDWEVPVLEIDGRKLAKYRIDEERLLRLLREG
jgi:glutaredoxin